MWCIDLMSQTWLTKTDFCGLFIYHFVLRINVARLKVLGACKHRNILLMPVLRRNLYLSCFRLIVNVYHICFKGWHCRNNDRLRRSTWLITVDRLNDMVDKVYHSWQVEMADKVVLQLTEWQGRQGYDTFDRLKWWTSL